MIKWDDWIQLFFRPFLAYLPHFWANFFLFKNLSVGSPYGSLTQGKVSEQASELIPRKLLEGWKDVGKARRKDEPKECTQKTQRSHHASTHTCRSFTGLNWHLMGGIIMYRTPEEPTDSIMSCHVCIM